MTAHMSPGQIARYCARTLTPPEVVAFHEHLEGCRECRDAVAEATLAGLPSTVVPILNMPGTQLISAHLTEEEMVAFVDQRLPGAAAHLSICELCRDSVAAMELERDFISRPAVSRRVPWFPMAGALAAGLLLAALVHYWPGHPAVLASLRDAGGTIQLDAGENLRGLDNASPEERGLVIDALKKQSLPAGPRVPVEGPGVLLAPDAAQPEFSLTGPINTRVLSDRPLFTWKSYPGASAYQVVVTTETLDPLARSGRISDTQWTPETPLPRGVVLLWQVRAWKGGEMVSAPAPPAPPARFEIASAQIAARLQQLRASPQPSHLLAAILSAREGLRDEARRELQSLARENPDSPLPGKLFGEDLKNPR